MSTKTLNSSEFKEIFRDFKGELQDEHCYSVSGKIKFYNNFPRLIIDGITFQDEVILEMNPYQTEHSSFEQISLRNCVFMRGLVINVSARSVEVENCQIQSQISLEGSQIDSMACIDSTFTNLSLKEAKISMLNLDDSRFEQMLDLGSSQISSFLGGTAQIDTINMDYAQIKLFQPNHASLSGQLIWREQEKHVYSPKKPTKKSKDRIDLSALRHTITYAKESLGSACQEYIGSDIYMPSKLIALQGTAYKSSF